MSAELPQSPTWMEPSMKLNTSWMLILHLLALPGPTKFLLPITNPFLFLLLSVFPHLCGMFFSMSMDPHTHMASLSHKKWALTCHGAVIEYWFLFFWPTDSNPGSHILPTVVIHTCNRVSHCSQYRFSQWHPGTEFPAKYVHPSNWEIRGQSTRSITHCASATIMSCGTA